MIRAFFALPLPAVVEAALWQGSRQLEQLPVARFLRWIPSQNYHLTLAFLGDINRADVARLDAIAGATAARHYPLKLTISRVCWFPSVAKPLMLAALLEDCPGLNKLQGDLQQQLRLLGFTVEKRQFRPHISLARARRGLQPCDPGDKPLAIEMAVDELRLMKSELRPEGARYTSLSAQFLG